MQKKSSLNFLKIEHQSKVLLRNTILCTGFFRLILCLIGCGVAYAMEPDMQAWFVAAMFFLCFCGMHSALRVLDKTSRRVRFILLIEVFYILILAYLYPPLFFWEYMFIPLALFDIALMFSSKTTIVLQILIGILFVPFMSNTFHTQATIIIRQIHFPLQLITYPFYIGISAISIFVVLVISRQKQMLHIHSSEISINRNLDSINRVLAMEMFSVKAESELRAKLQITKDIHDNVGYIFTNLTMMLQAAEAVYKQDADKAKDMLSNCVDYSCKGMNEIRNTLRVIRTVEKPVVHLKKDLQDLIALFSRCTGTKVTIEYGNWPNAFTAEIDSFLLSFFKECLTNAVKHGMADMVQITCWQSKKEISATVRDNGTGASEPLSFGIGLHSIHDAAIELGGALAVIRPEEGFALRVHLPAISQG